MKRTGFLSLAALLAIAFAAAPAAAAIPVSERAALIAFYQSTNGALWANRTNWRNADDTDFNAPGTECTWAGVFCDATGSTVTQLIYNSNFPLCASFPNCAPNCNPNCNPPSNTLPAELGNLPNLAVLSLAASRLVGPIPPELGNLTKLSYLDLNWNRVSGTIPSSLGNLQNLQDLRLIQNLLEGEVPAALLASQKLAIVALGENRQLTGSLEPFCDLGAVEVLDLHWDGFPGPIPPCLGSLTSLRSLDLSWNGLQGEIPDEIGGLTQLRNLNLSLNRLSGDLFRADGSSWLDGLGNLEQLFLNNNNSLSGALPPEIGVMPKLSILALNWNDFEGPVPDLGGLAEMTRLGLSWNPRLTGTLYRSDGTSWLGDLRKLRHLDLRVTNIGGEIPSELGLLVDLEELWLGQTPAFTGHLPDVFQDLQRLRLIEIQRTSISGPIPPSIGNLSHLIVLALDDNYLTGPIPASLGNLHSVYGISLSHNRLSGPIPPELGDTSVKRLSLEGNALSGPIPVELTNLRDAELVNVLFNALYAADPAVQAFMDAKFPGWMNYQTVAPVNLAVGAVTADSVDLSWTPILYTGNGGGYRVLYSTSRIGPYEVAGMTANKGASSFHVTGLDDGTTYWFKVQTVSNPHFHLAGPIESEPSEPVGATTVPLNQPPVVTVAPLGTGLDEGQLVGLAASFGDELNDLHTATIAWGDGVVEPGVVTESGAGGTVSGSHAYADNGAFTVTVTVTDDRGATGMASAVAMIANLQPTLGLVIGPLDPVQVGNAVGLGLAFTDPGGADTHTAAWSWGDGTSGAGSVSEAGGAGTVTGSHSYLVPGVYAVGLTVTDDDGGAATAEYRYVVVFDPAAGFVTGGGWIDSPAGAYAPDPALVGKATFGFVSRYERGATVPTGNTAFRFRAANLDFNSTSYQWLVVAGAQAKFKGYGTINGVAGYGFLLSAVDGALPGGGGVDRFRIKIWATATGSVVYDNQMGMGDDATPSTALGGGSIVIHK